VATTCAQIEPCPSDLACRCYQDGPIGQACYCTTTCTGDQDCGDPARPTCGREDCNHICLPPGAPASCCDCRCAAPDTPIATPAGDRPIASLREGDLVLSLDGGRLAAVPILRTNRVAVANHHVVEVRLESGTRLHISDGHPTGDGRRFSDLAPGDRLGDARVVSVMSVPYGHPFTHDILPASDSGTYLAGGALVGSTLRH
jgi:hypothetical protein